MSSAIALLTSTFSHLRDVLGEKGAASVLRYAAAEAARDCRLERGGDRLSGLGLIEAATGMHVSIALSSFERLAVTVRESSPREDFRDPATMEALLVGYLQGLYGAPAAAPPLVEVTTVSPHDLGEVGR